MLNHFAIACITAAVLTTPAIAKSNPCASEEVKEAITSSLKDVRTDDGVRLGSYASFKLVGTPTTAISTATKLACNISVEIKTGGDARTIRGRITYQQFGNGQVKAVIDLGY